MNCTIVPLLTDPHSANTTKYSVSQESRGVRPPRRTSGQDSVGRGGPTQREESGTPRGDSASLLYNDHLTLTGIPPEAFDYRLGNRSALDWIVDQYQVSTDKRSSIVNDPNRADNPNYILSLIKRVTTVSVETVKIVKEIEQIELQ